MIARTTDTSSKVPTHPLFHAFTPLPSLELTTEWHRFLWSRVPTRTHGLRIRKIWIWWIGIQTITFEGHRFPPSLFFFINQLSRDPTHEQRQKLSSSGHSSSVSSCGSCTPYTKTITIQCREQDSHGDPAVAGDGSAAEEMTLHHRTIPAHPQNRRSRHPPLRSNGVQGSGRD